jgi:tetratricopeptide (TPR) repeat protein
MKKIALAAALAAALLPARAETIRMRDGSYHSGEVVSADETVVRIRFAATGLELELKWDQLAAGEARRLKARAAMEKASRTLIEGEVIYTKNETLEGVVESESGESLKLKTAKGLKHVMKSSILRREKAQINALSVYSPDQLYDSKSGLYKLDTPGGNFDLGDLCLAIGLFEKAREHFTKALELDATWKDRVDPRLAKAEAGIQEAAAAAMLKEAEALLAADKLEEALAKLQEIVEKYPGTPAASRAAELAAKGEQDVEALKGEQKKAADLKRAKAYYDEMTALIRRCSSDKKLTFQQMKDYVEKTMPGEILDKLAEKEKADRAQFESEWKSRQLDEWKPASYGEGSWLMEPDKLAIEEAENLDDVQKRAKNQALITELKKQTAEMRKDVDGWWGKQTSSNKIAWLTAYAAEKTMIIKPVEHPNCLKCAGKGVLGASTLCTRCLGIGKDRLVQYK